MVIVDHSTQFLVQNQFNPLIPNPAAFNFIINITKEGEVVTKYTTLDGSDATLPTTGIMRLHEELKKCDQKATELEITFNGHYEYIEELSEAINKYCSKTTQTVKLVENIDAELYNFKFEYAKIVILESVKYNAKSRLLGRFLKMETLILIQCDDEKSLYLSENIPRVTHLSILIIYPSAVEKLINDISKMNQLTKLAIIHCELLLVDMQQISSLPKLEDVTLHWRSGNDFQGRIKWFLEVMLNLKKFTVVASQEGVPESNFNEFVRTLEKSLLGRLISKEQIVGDAAYVTSFYLKVRCRFILLLFVFSYDFLFLSLNCLASAEEI